MPITRRQFELGIDQGIEVWMKIISTFLKSHNDEAFTPNEIHAGIGLDRPALPSPDTLPPLDTLLPAKRRRGRPPKQVLAGARDDTGNIEDHLRRRQDEQFDAALLKLVELNVACERIVVGQRYYATGRCSLEDTLKGNSVF